MEWPYDHPRRGKLPPDSYVLNESRLQAAQAALRAELRPLHQRDELAAARRGPGLHQELLRQREGPSLHRHQLLVGALARARRQDQRLGTAGAAAVRLRLQGGEPRRLRRRLADLLRRRRAVLRPGRPLSRHFRRHREPAVAAGLDLPAADASLNPAEVHMRGALAQKKGWVVTPFRLGVTTDGLVAQQVPLALLRPRRLLPPRRRLRHPRRVRFADRPDLSGLGHRPPHGAHQRDRAPGADGSAAPARRAAWRSSTPRRASPTRPRRRSSCSPPRRSSRRASCCCRSRASIRTASPTPPATSATTSASTCWGRACTASTRTASARAAATTTAGRAASTFRASATSTTSRRARTSSAATASKARAGRRCFPRTR